MTVSNLDTGQGALWTGIVSYLSALGYTYDRNAQSRTQFLAVAVTGITGSSVSNLRFSFDELLALLLTNLGGSSVSASSLSRAQLLAGVYNSLAGGGGGGGSSFELREDGSKILREDASSVLREAA